MIKKKWWLKKEKKKGEEYCKYGVGESVVPQIRVIRKLKITIWWGKKRLRNHFCVSRADRLPWKLLGFVLTNPSAVSEGLSGRCSATWGHFWPLPNPTGPEMLRVGTLRTPRSALFPKQNLPVLGKPGSGSLVPGFLGMVPDGPSQGHPGVGLWGQPGPRSYPRPTEQGHRVPSPHDGTLKLSNNFISFHLMWNLFFFPCQKPRRSWRSRRGGHTAHTTRRPPWNPNVPGCPQPTPRRDLVGCTPSATTTGRVWQRVGHPPRSQAGRALSPLSGCRAMESSWKRCFRCTRKTC